MSISDDIPPSDDFPPPMKKAIDKISNKSGLNNYLTHLSAYQSYHLLDLTRELQEGLLLQGLDQNDLYSLHEFLAIEFDNGFIKTNDKELTKRQVKLLQKYL